MRDSIIDICSMMHKPGANRSICFIFTILPSCRVFGLLNKAVTRWSSWSQQVKNFFEQNITELSPSLAASPSLISTFQGIPLLGMLLAHSLTPRVLQVTAWLLHQARNCLASTSLTATDCPVHRQEWHYQPTESWRDRNKSQLCENHVYTWFFGPHTFASQKVLLSPYTNPTTPRQRNPGTYWSPFNHLLFQCVQHIERSWEKKTMAASILPRTSY